MAYILHLETSTKQCSVALAFEGKLLKSRVLNLNSFSHSEKLHLFINEVLQEAGLTPKDLGAIAISKGPGSYTGLRIGVAAAKGLCFALDLPLIALNSLEVMVIPQNTDGFDYIIPMLDARRMEVYTAIFDAEKKWVQETSALVLSEDAYLDIVGLKRCLLFGDGASKFKELQSKINAKYLPEVHFPNAEDMVAMAWVKFSKNDFESLAYFEPFYLKDFQVTPPKQQKI